MYFYNLHVCVHVCYCPTIHQSSDMLFLSLLLLNLVKQLIQFETCLKRNALDNMLKTFAVAFRVQITFLIDGNGSALLLLTGCKYIFGHCFKYN